MQFMRLTTVRVSADVISGILNGVCPECGGRMGGPGKEFQVPGRMSERLASGLGASPFVRTRLALKQGDQLGSWVRGCRT